MLKPRPEDRVGSPVPDAGLGEGKDGVLPSHEFPVMEARNMIKHFENVGNRLVESPQDCGQILVAVAPDDRERALIQERFQLDDYDLNSTLDPDEIPRLELADGRLLLIWKVPENATVSDSIELGVSVVGLVLIQDRLAFLRATHEVSFADREFRNVGDVKDVMLAFFLRTVRHFVGHLRAIKQVSAELEKKITVSMENKHLLQMFSLSESLVYYVDAIEGNAAMLAKLRNIAAQNGFQPRHLEVLDDIILDNAQAARQAGIYSSVLSGLMDARGTIVNNNMNVLLKNLTLINIVFLPLNLIASIGGMSEWSMITRGLDWRISYSLFCIGMVVFGWCTWLLMKKLIDRPPSHAGRSTGALAARRPR
ncbi:MAG TPA: magnesium transporter CorA family protein [Sedimentisphaerales bacterium]|nr:magnesium transporter CorA family protein [Sedimentisphaerales bacterium]HRS11908.1 magnesium transporter CorA family protein [Sedimentisphaerales bacterium]HRV48585.1 magnesium transporter CorA family protein [Sedimentisphaerales bacterium]